jgi:asparagine synthase (glutamine-hydrolysing)
MFAIAFWDNRTQQLFLIRDRLGIKPLYYYYDKDVFLFASELKALMAFSHFKRDVDPESIALFLHYQYIPTPKCIFKNTFKLPPAYYLTYDGNGIRTQKYWEPPAWEKGHEMEKQSEEEILNTLDTLIGQAVSDRLISDVPLGALLSGGIDSSLVVALMQKAHASPVQTYTIGFREADYDEAPWASKVADYLGTDHHELYVTQQEAMGVIPKLSEIYDEPFADSSAIPTYLVSQLARSEVTVALSGDGGDEQFAGYVRYWTAQTIWRYMNGFPPWLIYFMRNLSDHLSSQLLKKCYSILYPVLPQRLKVTNFEEKWQKLRYVFRQTNLAELYRMTICLWSKGALESLMGVRLTNGQFEETFEETKGWPLLARLMRVDQKTYLPDAMLTKVDRASMAVSLEVRVPLLDHRVVEYTARLPEIWKYRNGSGKYILKKLLARYLPIAFFDRPKMGFGVPIDSWFRKDLKPLLLDYLSTERIKREELFNEKIIQQTIREHLDENVNHQYRLWTLLMWEMWRERWMKN